MESRIGMKPGGTKKALLPFPKTLVCVDVPKIFDQMSKRDCVTRSVALLSGPGAGNPIFTFDGAEDFHLTEVKTLSKTDVPLKPGYKRVRLLLKMGYQIRYSDGVNRLTKRDEAVFYLTLHAIFYPDYPMQKGSIHYPRVRDDSMDSKRLMIQVDALVQAFHDMVDASKALLHLEIGVFFIVKVKGTASLLLPSYGYCPTPPEQ